MHSKKIEIEVKNKYKKTGAMSIAYVMRKHQISFESASNILEILSKSTCKGIYNNINRI